MIGIGGGDDDGGGCVYLYVYMWRSLKLVWKRVLRINLNFFWGMSFFYIIFLVNI